MTATDIFGIGICAVCAVVFGALVKKSNKEYALVMTVTAAVLILLAVLQKAEPLVEQIEELAGSGMFHGDYILVMLKAVGITIVGQMTSQVCKDAGEAALGYTVDLAAKVAVLAVSFPVLLKLFEYLGEIMKL